MAEAIKLKSKAVSIYDYHQVDISRFITGFSVDEAQYRKDLDRILRRFGRRESVSQVGSGDAVIVNFYTPCILGLVLMLLGSHMFDCTEDAKLALRFSFTVNNPPLWKEVHRFAGWLWMLAGLVVAAGAMVTSETTFFSALLALVVLVVPMIYGRSRAGQANG